jgi:hypothetical protein
MDLGALRQERYEIAISILDGEHPQNEELRLKQAMDGELLRIQELDEMYRDAKLEADELIEDTREEVDRMEKVAEMSVKDLEMLEETVNRMKKNRAKQAESALSEAERDSKTYATASGILRERINQARNELMNLEAVIESREQRSVMRNAEAQALWLQLRALLSAQDRELRSKLRPLSQIS